MPHTEPITFLFKPLNEGAPQNLSQNDADRMEREAYEAILRARLQAVADHLNTLISIGRARDAGKIYVGTIGVPLNRDAQGVVTADLSSSPTLAAFVAQLQEHVAPIGLTVEAELMEEGEETPKILPTIWLVLVPKEA